MNTTVRLQYLEKQLDREDLSQEEFTEFNTEANALQDEINQIKARRLTDKQFELQSRINHIAELAREGRMVELVETYGSEFEESYVILENFTVLSGCVNTRNPNGTNCWEFGCIEDALAKKFQLIYWRVYDHYVRNKGE